MAKVKTAFFCSNCGYESAKWVGKCPSCGTWNTFVEEVISKPIYKKRETDGMITMKKQNHFVLFHFTLLKSSEQTRIATSDAELNRVLGGGIVPGSIVLIAGEPGIGKSTLFLQNGLQLQGKTVLYISGEESEQQIKMRADRLNIQNDNFYLLTETANANNFPGNKKTKAAPGYC